MRSKIVNILKTNSFLYDLYFTLGSFLLKILGLLVKSDDKLILFVSFGGKGYDDSPRVIYEKMIQMEDFNDYKFYWAFINPEKYNILKGSKIKIDTLRYFIIAQKAKVWITNSAIERGLKFKKKTTFYINTWHGTPIKKIGKEGNNVNVKSGFGSKNISSENIFLAQSTYDAHIFSRVFNIGIENIKCYDLPRNDELVKDNQELRQKIRDDLKIPQEKKVILYAPTYREFQRDKNNSCVLKPPIDFEKWYRLLGDDYIVLVRAHYEVVDVLGIHETDFVKNVSTYGNLNELMIISDILISDYSSIFVDYSILSKPMFCFAYDLDEYREKRGIYIDLEQELPGTVHQDENSLLQDILFFDKKKMEDEVKIFKNKYAPVAGNATNKVIELIKEV